MVNFNAEGILTGMILVAPVVLMGGAGYSTVASLLAPIPVQEIGNDIETWSVSAPTEEIPTTNGDYRPYNIWKSHINLIPESLQHALPEVERKDTVMVKIEPHQSATGFTLCMYQGDWDKEETPEILSYDSVTGEEAVNKTKVCS